eukprot:727427-Hanusia_phi.AAC.1
MVDSIIKSGIVRTSELLDEVRLGHVETLQSVRDTPLSLLSLPSLPLLSLPSLATLSPFSPSLPSHSLLTEAADLQRSCPEVDGRSQHRGR